MCIAMSSIGRYNDIAMLDLLIGEMNPWWRDPGARVGGGYPNRRDLFEGLWRRLGNPESRRAVVLLGPRQTGKTVLIRQLVDELLDARTPPSRILRFDFSDDRLSSPPPSPREVIACAPQVQEGGRTFVLLDEVQRVPHWDLWLKQAVDAGGLAILATGSSALRLREGSIESGVGRWDEVRIEGLTYREFLRLGAVGGMSLEDRLELQPAALERYLALGGSPAHHSGEPGLELRRRIREDIVDKAILKDLLPTGVDVAKVKDLLLYLVGCSGSQFNATKRASHLGADARSLRSYLRLLEDAGLVSTLHEYPVRVSGRKRTARSQLQPRPKIYAADHGPISAFSHYPEPTADSDTRERIFEAVVFRHLRWAAEQLDVESPFFYRRQNDLETDFLLELRGGKVGIEVTAGTHLVRKARRLREAQDRLVLGKALIVGPASTNAAGGINVIDLQRFLLDPVRYAGIDDRR